MSMNTRSGNTLLDTGFFPPCRVATTAAITLSGIQTIDGIVTFSGDRVLVKDQTDLTVNGIYAVSSGNWSRTTDAQSNAQFFDGMAVLIARGARNAGTIWQCTSTDDPVIIGSSQLTFGLQSAISAASLIATSTTTQTIGLGNFTYVTQSGKGFTAGGWVTIASAANPLNYTVALVTGYSGTSLSVAVAAVSGSGSHSDWTIVLSGPPGPSGTASAQLFDTRTLAAAATIGASINFVRTAGYSVVGDLGGALYKRVVGTTTGGFQSADGAWWEIHGLDLYLEMFGGKGDGSTNDQAALQAVIDVAGASGGGRPVVFVGSKTYALTSGVAMRAGVRLIGNGASITQPNSTNITTWFDFAAHASNDCEITNLAIDGNRSNNTDSTTAAIFSVASAHRVRISKCTFANVGGSCITVTTGTYPDISDNTFTNFYWLAVWLLGNVSGFASHGTISGNKFNYPFGLHAIRAALSDYVKITNNTVNADYIGGVNNILTVTISGQTITRVSGPTFSGAANGMVVNTTFGEAVIDNVVSTSQVHVTSAIGDHTGIVGYITPGDNISIDGSSFCICSQNHVNRGSIVITNEGDGVFPGNAFKNQIINNNIERSLGSGISIQTVTNMFTVQDTLIANNVVVDSGYGGTANQTSGNQGISVIDFSAGNNIKNTSFYGNYVRDNQFVIATINNWLYLSGTSAGSVFVGDNSQVGCINSGISGGATVTLDSAWGNGAGVSGLVSHGGRVFFTVTSAGTGQGANPTVTVNTFARSPENIPVRLAKMVGGSGTTTGVGGEGNSTAQAIIFTFLGTPVAGSTYQFQIV